MSRMLRTSCALTGLALAACTTVPRPTTAAPSAPTPPAPTPPAPAPSAPAPPAPAPPAQTAPLRSLSLVATGDVLLHPGLWQQALQDGAVTGGEGALDFGPQLSGVRPHVSSADLAVCHLETPLAPPGGPYRGYPAFAAPPQVVPALAAAGYDACTTASNHSFDQGAGGIDRTLDDLDAAGLAHTGTARTRQEADEVRVLDVRTPSGTVRVALLSYTFGFNGVAAPGGQTWRGNLLDEQRVLRDAAAARRQGSEITVVALHWGDEFVQTPSAQQLGLAPRLLASPDVDLLLGHHSHVVEPLQSVGGKWVTYGLGNLLAAHGTPGEPLREGLLVRFVLTERPGGGFTTSDAGYAPLLVTEAPVHRVLDVATALRAGGAPGASPDRLARAWARTARVVDSRGAAAAGLRPLSVP